MGCGVRSSSSLRAWFQVFAGCTERVNAFELAELLRKIDHPYQRSAPPADRGPRTDHEKRFAPLASNLLRACQRYRNSVRSGQAGRASARNLLLIARTTLITRLAVEVSERNKGGSAIVVNGRQPSQGDLAEVLDVAQEERPSEQLLSTLTLFALGGDARLVASVSGCLTESSRLLFPTDQLQLPMMPTEEAA